MNKIRALNFCIHLYVLHLVCVCVYVYGGNVHIYLYMGMYVHITACIQRLKKNFGELVLPYHHVCPAC